MELPADLRTALDTALSGIGVRHATGTVERLIEAYRAGGPATTPILTTVDDVLAYAGYRLPATYSAVRAALQQVGSAAPGFAPQSLVDLGGGSGAAAWAAMEQFRSLTRFLVLDQVEPALNLGRQLAQPSRLYRAEWRVTSLTDGAVPPADLVTLSYVLGELTAADQLSVVSRAAAAASGLVVVEPGTPAGYERILRARQVMLDEGLTVVAPCPHQRACPMVAGQDWCHFSVRVNRSAVHRRLKGADLGYEDEKFAYVAAIRDPDLVRQPGRVLRHPARRKGLVALYVCTPTEGLARLTVSKRQGDEYRAARDVSWGDPWPPEPPATTP